MDNSMQAKAKPEAQLGDNEARVMSLGSVVASVLAYRQAVIPTVFFLLNQKKRKIYGYNRKIYVKNTVIIAKFTIFVSSIIFNS